MDTNTVIVIGLVIFAIIVIVYLLRFRGSASASVKTPIGLNFEVKGSNPAPAEATTVKPPAAPGVNVVNAQSHGGGLVAQDKTGRGANVEHVEVQDDILVSSAPPDENNPKA